MRLQRFYRTEFMDTDQSQLDELERQLSHPFGEKAVEVADMMHATNIGMTQATLDQLQLESGHRILELGHGNCAHLPLVLGKAPGLHYTGWTYPRRCLTRRDVSTPSK